MTGEVHEFDPQRVYKVLIADHVRLMRDDTGIAAPTDVQLHIEAQGGVFHFGGIGQGSHAPGIHFFYQPDLADENVILAQTSLGQFDSVIVAATPMPVGARFDHGGVRIGAGTGNMRSASWGGASGVGGVAPLMNTPSFNSVVTAQMVMKAVLRVLPDLPLEELHTRSVEGRFDTGRDLKDFPTEKIEGKTMAIIGYGNIGRSLAKLADAFGMVVRVHARPSYQRWIEAEGFDFVDRLPDVAADADVLSVHTGLGMQDVTTGKWSNAGLIDSAVLGRLRPGAVLINFDRGECVDVSALDAALATGQVRHAAIDADVFVQGETLSGPLAPYVPLAKKYPGRVLLLPHAAADTDHVSRVDGAKQAVDQILSCIRTRRVINLKGDCPPGFVNGGSKTKPGVGSVTVATLAAALQDEVAVAAMQTEARVLLDVLGQLTRGECDPKTGGARLVLASTKLISTLRAKGLEGPFRPD